MSEHASDGGPGQPGPPALVVIDMQEIFRDPSSQWATEGYDQAAERIVQLVNAAAGPVIWTRFVRDEAEPGSWQAYYDRWASCREDPDSLVWDLTMPVREADHVLTLPTFSKWGDQLAALTAEHDHLIICGVATDCCVLSTVLGAADAGKRITVAKDACAGATTKAHEQASALMEMLAPMVQLADTAQIVEGSMQRA